MVVLKNTGLYGRAPAYLRKSMTSTSQPKLVSHATMPAVGSSVFSVILACQPAHGRAGASLQAWIHIQRPRKLPALFRPVGGY